MKKKLRKFPKKLRLIPNFYIPDPLYHKPLLVVYDCTAYEFSDYLAEEHPEINVPRDNMQDAKYAVVTEVSGKKKGWYCYMWVNHADPRNTRDVACIAHELIHHTFFVLDRVGVDIIYKKSEEAFAYYHTYMLEQTLSYLEVERKEQRRRRKTTVEKIRGGVDKLWKRKA